MPSAALPNVLVRCVIAASAVLLACGDGADEVRTFADEGNAGLTVTGVVGAVSVAAGGELAIASPPVVVTVPPNAVSSDTDLSLERAKASWLRGVPGWSFSLAAEEPQEPLLQSAMVEVDVHGLTAPASWLAPELFLEGEGPYFTWPEVAEAEHEAEWMSVPITQTGKYGVDWQALGMPDNCRVTPSSFVPCGGAIEGNWMVEGECYDERFFIGYERPVEFGKGSDVTWKPTGELPEGTPRDAIREAVDEWPMTGRLTVERGRFVHTEVRPRIPLIEAFYPGKFAKSCAEFSRMNMGDASFCPGQHECRCKWKPTRHLPALNTPVRTNGTWMFVGDARYSYCVEGDRLRLLRLANGDPRVMVWRRAE